MSTNTVPFCPSFGLERNPNKRRQHRIAVMIDNKSLLTSWVIIYHPCRNCPFSWLSSPPIFLVIVHANFTGYRHRLFSWLSSPLISVVIVPTYFPGYRPRLFSWLSSPHILLAIVPADFTGYRPCSVYVFFFLLMNHQVISPCVCPYKTMKLKISHLTS
jgi:hypothetical protein